MAPSDFESFRQRAILHGSRSDACVGEREREREQGPPGHDMIMNAGVSSFQYSSRPAMVG